MRGLSFGLGFTRDVVVADSGYDPSTDADLFHWLDASDTGTITLSVSNVTQWDDKGANGYDLVQSTGTNRPFSGTRTQNGLNVVDFQNNDFMFKAYGLTYAQPLTQVVVAKFDDFTQTDYLTDRTGAGTCSILAESSNFKLSSPNLVGTSAGDNDPHVFICVFDGVTSKLYVDGVLQYTIDAGTNGMDGLAVGSLYNGGSTFFYLDGFIAEFIGLERVATTDDVAAITTYATSKWGL
jgi:hypothetical protein